MSDLYAKNNISASSTLSVGQTLLEIIEHTQNSFEKIKLFASKSSAGKIITLGKIKIMIEAINKLNEYFVTDNNELGILKGETIADIYDNLQKKEVTKPIKPKVKK